MPAEEFVHLQYVLTAASAQTVTTTNIKTPSSLKSQFSLHKFLLNYCVGVKNLNKYFLYYFFSKN
jgi:hypothetical protein